MGCDIHTVVERRRPDGVWRPIAGQMKQCYGCHGTGKTETEKDSLYPQDTGKPGVCRWCKGTGRQRDEWLSGRHYDFFALLANVRNNGSIVPLAQPRGMPKNFSMRKQFTSVDLHSHSYFTLEELIAVDWNNVKREVTYFVSPAQYAAYLADPTITAKEEWQGYYNLFELIQSARARTSTESARIHAEMPSWLEMNNVEMRNIAESGVLLDKHYTQLTVLESTFIDVIGDLNELRAKCEKRYKLPLKHMRFVFCFDN